MYLLLKKLSKLLESTSGSTADWLTQSLTCSALDPRLCTFLCSISGLPGVLCVCVVNAASAIVCSSCVLLLKQAHSDEEFIAALGEWARRHFQCCLSALLAVPLPQFPLWHKASSSPSHRGEMQSVSASTSPATFFFFYSLVLNHLNNRSNSFLGNFPASESRFLLTFWDLDGLSAIINVRKNCFVGDF